MSWPGWFCHGVRLHSESLFGSQTQPNTSVSCIWLDFDAGLQRSMMSFPENWEFVSPGILNAGGGNALGHHLGVCTGLSTAGTQVCCNINK